MDKEEVKKAKDLFDQYNKRLNKKFIKPLKCVICKDKIIKPNLEYDLNVDPLKQDEAIWIDGTCIKVLIKHGSSFDGNAFFMGVCDECIKTLKEDGLIIDKTILKNKYYKEII